MLSTRTPTSPFPPQFRRLAWPSGAIFHVPQDGVRGRIAAVFRAKSEHATHRVSGPASEPAPAPSVKGPRISPPQSQPAATQTPRNAPAAGRNDHGRGSLRPKQNTRRLKWFRRCFHTGWFRKRSASSKYSPPHLRYEGPFSPG